MKNTVLLALLLGFLATLGCREVDPPPQTGCEPNCDTIPVASPATVKGVSLVAPRNQPSGNPLQPISNINGNWVALMPFAFGREGDANLRWDLSGQWWGETLEGMTQFIQWAKEYNLKVLMKPHLWIWGGSFVGDFSLNSDAEWRSWEQDYLAYLLDYAHLADSLSADMFCIGVELREFVKARPAFWDTIITEVKKVYSGPLVYAGNWDNYKNIPFWNQLDYMGIDAYFPLSQASLPTTEALITGWEQHYQEIKAQRDQYNIPVLFTEFGYRSVEEATKEPWNPPSSNPVNTELQARAYEAAFQVFWNEPWFEGGFIWNWYTNHNTAGGELDKDYTPQNKPAEQVLQDWFSRN